jgi:hypothetical protein
MEEKKIFNRVYERPPSRQIRQMKINSPLDRQKLIAS